MWIETNQTTQRQSEASPYSRLSIRSRQAAQASSRPRIAEPILAQDRLDVSSASLYKRAKRLELQYGQRLRKIARHVGDIVHGFDLGTVDAARQAGGALRRYADTLDPWANAVAERMVREVSVADKTFWQRLGSKIGRSLRQEIETAPTGIAMRELMARQVGLIKSLPLDAAERVHKLTQEGITQGKRADEIAKEIMVTGDVTRSRATLIARTEVARTATELTKARAQSIGSEGYIWRSVRDSDVRPSHKKMEGKFVRWDDPPTLDGMTGHAGGLPNCRCTVEVVIPE